VHNGISIDQMCAQKFGSQSRAPSIELCIENTGLSESCGFNYSCVYSETISWASATEPARMTVNPRVAFEELFGGSGRGSVLDGVREDASRLRQELRAEDRRRLNAHLEEVRAVERHIAAIERHNASAVERERAAPLGIPDSWEEDVKLMFDLQMLAFAADVTRVSAFKMSRDTNNRVGETEEYRRWRRESAGSFAGVVRESDGRFEHAQSPGSADSAGGARPRAIEGEPALRRGGEDSARRHFADDCVEVGRGGGEYWGQHGTDRDLAGALVRRAQSRRSARFVLDKAARMP
jgi:hypothetical protein